MSAPTTAPATAPTQAPRPSVATLARSVLFLLTFYPVTVFWFFLALPALLAPPNTFPWLILHPWSRVLLFVHRAVCGVTVEVRGREHIPTGGYLIASKHQSAWETLFLAQAFPWPTYILKRELMWLPMFGWYLKKGRQIPIDRGSGSRVLAAMNLRAKETIAAGRQIIIFPEGTRRPVGAPPAYKSGVGRIYESTGAPCLPVALNAGVFWPRRSFLKYPGRIIVEFLPVIEPGLRFSDVMARVQADIETATARLVAEAGDPSRPAS